MLESLPLYTSILNFDNSISNILFRRNITKKDVEDLITKHQLTESFYRERILIVLNENQELMYDEINGEISIKSNKDNVIEFRRSLVSKICQKFELEKINNYEQIKQKSTFKSIAKKW